MDCTESLEKMAAYLDGQLGPADIELFERHLEQCSNCSTVLEGLAGQDLAPPDLAPDMASKLEDPAFWSRMDAVLARELDKAPTDEPRGPIHINMRALALYAAGFILALVWGAHNHHRARVAEARVQHLAEQVTELEEAQRTAEPPAVMPSSRPLSDFSLATHTPHRGTF